MFSNKKNNYILKSLLGAASALSVLLFSYAAFAFEAQGRVDVRYGRIIMLDTGKVLIIKGDAVFKNMRHLGEAKRGGHLRAGGDEEVSGVLLVGELEVDPEVEVGQGLNMPENEFFRLLKEKGDYVLVDVRPREAYEAGHIPTAVSIDEFDIGKISDDTRIVFYAGSDKDPAALTKAIFFDRSNGRVYAKGFQGWIWANRHAETTAGHVRKRLAEGKPLIVVDTRPTERVGEGRIPGAVSIPLEELASKKILKGVAFPAPMVFYGEDGTDSRAAKAAATVSSWGYGAEGHSMASVLTGGFREWKKTGGKTVTGEAPTEISYAPLPGSAIVGMEEFKALWMEKGGGKTLVDASGNTPPQGVDFVTSISIEEFPFRVSEIPADKEVIVYCAFGFRAKIAYHILNSNGYKARYLNRNPGIMPDGNISE